MCPQGQVLLNRGVLKGRFDLIRGVLKGRFDLIEVTSRAGLM
jgi:hypothetical protein